jgi:hypothetical protein
LPGSAQYRAQALFPKWIDRTQAAAQALPGRSFARPWNFLFFASVTLGFMAMEASRNLLHPELCRCPLAARITIGMAGIVELIDAPVPVQLTLKRTALAAAILFAACLTPFIGWFGLAPYLGITGLGAFIHGFPREGTSTPMKDGESPARANELRIHDPEGPD